MASVNVENSPGSSPVEYVSEQITFFDTSTQTEASVESSESKPIINYRQHPMSVLRQQVTCPVCLDIPRVAGLVTCPNGHLVCENCYMGLRLHEVTQDKRCPTCRSKFGISLENHHGFHCTPPRSSIAQAILDIVTIECRFPGCNFACLRHHIRDHESECNYALMKCPLDCSKYLNHTDMFNHVKDKHLHKDFQFYVGSCKFPLILPPPGEEYQFYVSRMLLTNKEGSARVFMLIESDDQLQETKAWAYFLGKPGDRLKHKVKISVEVPRGSKEEYAYVGSLYGGGSATMEYEDKPGLVLPEKLIREKLGAYEAGEFVLWLTFELV